LKGLLLNHGLDREFRRMQKCLLHGAMVSDFDERVVAFFRRVRQHVDVYGDGIKDHFPSCFVAYSSRSVRVMLSSA